MRDRLRVEVYRAYVCEALRCALPAFGASMALTYGQAVERAERPPDMRTGDEIAADVVSRLGLEVEFG